MREGRMQPENARAGHLFAGTKTKRLRALGVALAGGTVFLMASATGCGPRSPSVTDPVKSSAIVIRVACPGEPAARVVAQYSQAWASEARKVEVVHYDASSGPEVGPPADVWVIPPARMPYWAAAGKLYAVPETYTVENGSYAWNKLLPLYRKKLLLWDGKAYALPLLGDALLCFYRRDLFAEEQHGVAFQKKYGRKLTAPATWEEFADIAEYFHNQQRPGIDHPRPSLPPLADGDDDLDRTFYAVAVSCARRAVGADELHPSANDVFSFHYDLNSGAVRIASLGFVHALGILQHLQSYRPAGPSHEPASAFVKGEAVLCLADPSWISRFQKNPLIRGKFGVCRVPGSAHVFDYRTGKEQVVPGGNWVPYLGAGGWIAVVPRSCEQPDAAFSLLASLSDPKTSRDIVIEPAWGGGAFRRDHLDDPDMGWQAFGLDADQTRSLVESLRQTVQDTVVANPVLRLRIPGERAHQQALDAEVRAALIDGKDPSQALAAAAQRWRELDARKDAKTRLAEYRLSLSLSRND